jgi:hypothetical protein
MPLTDKAIEALEPGPRPRNFDGSRRALLADHD